MTPVRSTLLQKIQLGLLEKKAMPCWLKPTCCENYAASDVLHMCTHLHWVAVPDVTLKDEGLAVRSPRISGPAKNLHEELSVCFEGGGKRALGGDLHGHLPAVRNNPACHEFIISRDQRVPVKAHDFLTLFNLLRSSAAARGADHTNGTHLLRHSSPVNSSANESLRIRLWYNAVRPERQDTLPS